MDNNADQRDMSISYDLFVNGKWLEITFCNIFTFANQCTIWEMQ